MLFYLFFLISLFFLFVSFWELSAHHAAIEGVRCNGACGATVRLTSCNAPFVFLRPQACLTGSLCCQ